MLCYMSSNDCSRGQTHTCTGVTPAPPTLPPFSFSCVLVFLTQQVSVTCESSRDLASLQYDCQLNGADLTEGCESQLMDLIAIIIMMCL